MREPWLDDELDATTGRDEQRGASSVYFDQRDYDLLRIVDDVLERREQPSRRRLLAPYLHPHGIKELASPQALRIAYAVARLLGSLETGEAPDRIGALSALRSEVLYTSQSSMRLNTARVLVEIMKNLLRSRGDELRRLELAHDFNVTSSGQPRIVRARLREYRLLEVPEAWNQVAFDDHVHDANTKGRKTATHLIMDAWIKGIRRLTVVYYNHVPRDAAQEVLEAAAIMEIEVRIGIELIARHRGRYVKLIWMPRGYSDARGFLAVLDLPEVHAFMEEGRKVSAHYRAYILKVLRAFNERGRQALEQAFSVEFPPLDEREFLAFVGSGQASIHHLARFIRERLRPLLLVGKNAPPDIYDIIESYLRPLRGREPGCLAGEEESASLPELMTLSPQALLARLDRLHSRFRLTLNLCDLRVEDVIELLYDCHGEITHLEIVNLKNRALGREHDSERIIALQAAINSKNVIKLKKLMVEILAAYEARDPKDERAEEDGRREKLRSILADIAAFRDMYADKALRVVLGSDSVGASARVQGMGLVLRDSLPHRAQRELDRKDKSGPAYRALRLSIAVHPRITLVPHAGEGAFLSRIYALARRIPALAVLGYRHEVDWVLGNYRRSPEGQTGNIYTLGGLQPCAQAVPGTEEGGGGRVPPRYLRTGLKIGLKLLIGFIPAFLTFALTKDWWLLAYGGAFIWFGITGLRNIIQAVLGSGGPYRSSLLKLGSIVSWNRLADSLLYTGFSVPLLDFVMKTLVLERLFGITVATDPFRLYATMSLVNGLYLAGHNVFRGLPRGVAAGNLLRSFLAIPLAFAFNLAAGRALSLAGVGPVAAAAALQKWAAIISKLASDCVAGAIEGLADKIEFMRMRRLDYQGKLRQMFDTYAQLELAFPMENVASLLASPETFMREVEHRRPDLADMLFANALDLLYFWLYQPRARETLRRSMRDMTREERRVFLLLQRVLVLEHRIGQLFIDGLVGRNFAKALACYLDHWRRYLADMERLVGSARQEPGGGRDLSRAEA